MLVYGELFRAQLEHLAVAPTGISGRQYLMTGGNNPEPTIYMNSVLFGPLDFRYKTSRDDFFYDSSNAGVPIALDFGLSHYFNLTTHLALSNTAPREPDLYTYRFYAGSGINRAARLIFPGDYELMGESYIPFFNVDQTRMYHFRYDATNTQPATNGNGTTTAPKTATAGACNHVAIHPSGRYIAYAHDSSPYLTIYSHRNGVIGAKLADTASTAPTGNGQGVAFSPDGMFVAIVHATSPYISVYEFDAESGFIGVKITDPATLPTGQGNGVAWSPEGGMIAVAHTTTPFVSVYPWTAAGFGVKLTNPATLPAGDGYAVAWKMNGQSYTSQYLAVAHDTTPFVSVYPIVSSAFGAKVTNPATLPAGSGRGVAFNPYSGHLAVAHTTTPYVSVYPFSTGFSPKIADPSILPGGNAEACCWSPDGSHLLVGGTTGTVRFYRLSPQSDVGTLTAVNGTTQTPATTATGVAVSNCARYAALSGSGATLRTLCGFAPRPPRTFFLQKSAD